MSRHAEVRAARPAEYPAVLETIRAAFGERVRSLMTAMLYDDPTLTPEDIRVAVVDGAIASAVRIADRPVRYGDATLRLAGIGAVATHPALRGQGFASLVLVDAARSMRERGYPLAVLFTGIPAFYTRLGWTAVPEPGFRLPLPSPPSNGLDDGAAIIVRPFDERRDLPAVMRVYDTFNAGGTGPYVRSRPYWTCAHSRKRHIMPARVAECAGEVVAYASTRPYETSLTLYEAGCANGAAAAFLPLAAAVLAQARDAGLGDITGWLPPGHPMRTAFQMLGGEQCAEMTHGGMMLLLLDLPALLQAALPALTVQRRRTPDVEPATLGLRVGDQYARLVASRDRLYADAEPADRTMQLSPAAFWRRFCGYRTLPNDPSDITLQGDDVAVLGALFSPRPFVYWRPDHF